jgi:hypothetical protein
VGNEEITVAQASFDLTCEILDYIDETLEELDEDTAAVMRNAVGDLTAISILHNFLSLPVRVPLKDAERILEQRLDIIRTTVLTLLRMEVGDLKQYYTDNDERFGFFDYFEQCNN